MDDEDPQPTQDSVPSEPQLPEPKPKLPDLELELHFRGSREDDLETKILPPREKQGVSAISGGPTAELIVEELNAERDWRRSLEQRALSLFASASVIGGLSSIAASATTLPVAARWSLGAALLALACGAFGGLLVAFPVLGPSVKAASLALVVDDADLWGADDSEHLVVTSRARLRMLAVTRRTNDRKTRMLRWAVVFAMGGVVALLSTVLIVLVSA